MRGVCQDTVAGCDLCLCLCGMEGSSCQSHLPSPDEGVCLQLDVREATVDWAYVSWTGGGCSFWKFNRNLLYFSLVDNRMYQDTN